MKTVVLCRHAESKENVKIRAFKEGKARLGQGLLPSLSQVRKSLSLLKYDLDQPVSPAGYEQIQSMADIVKNENFMENFQPEMVCHSPLQRARDTCRGIFGQRSNDLELTSLTEMSPAEIFLFSDSVKTRIREFEDWLDSRNEERIVAVGHSRYFKVMLNADEVMDNCSIIKCSYHPPGSSPSGKDEGDVADPAVSPCRWVVDEVLYTLQSHRAGEGQQKDTLSSAISNTPTATVHSSETAASVSITSSCGDNIYSSNNASCDINGDNRRDLDSNVESAMT